MVAASSRKDVNACASSSTNVALLDDIQFDSHCLGSNRDRPEALLRERERDLQNNNNKRWAVI